MGCRKQYEMEITRCGRMLSPWLLEIQRDYEGLYILYGWKIQVHIKSRLEAETFFPQQETHKARALGGVWYCLMMFVCHYLPRRDCAEAPVLHCPCSFTSTLPALHRGSTLTQHCSCESLVGAKSMTRRMKRCKYSRWSSMKHETNVWRYLNHDFSPIPILAPRNHFCAQRFLFRPRHLNIVGSHERLGAWDPAKARLMNLQFINCLWLLVSIWFTKIYSIFWYLMLFVSTLFLFLFVFKLC